MYIVVQKNPNGDVISGVTMPMTYLQSMLWIEDVKNKWLNLDKNVQFWIRTQAKEDILEKVLREYPPMLRGDWYTWYIWYAKNFEEYWEDYV